MPFYCCGNEEQGAGPCWYGCRCVCCGSCMGKLKRQREAAEQAPRQQQSDSPRQQQSDSSSCLGCLVLVVLVIVVIIVVIAVTHASTG